MSAADDRANGAAEPTGLIVLVDPGDRIHFLDWDGPTNSASDDPADPGGERPVVVLVHGLAGSAFVWTPVARRIRHHRHVVAMDLRGHGLSDAPTEPGSYDLDVLASDVIAVAEASVAGTSADRPVVLAGHGFGAIVAAVAAAALGDECAGLALVDGGLVDVAATTGLDVEEFVRGLDEPPEVMRSMAAYLEDRRAWDPSTWDADQEAAARATVVATPAGRLVPVTRPHVFRACVEAMFDYRPSRTLPRVRAPIVAVRRRTPGDETAAGEEAVPAGARIVDVEAPGHNVLRYRPDEISRAIVEVTSRMTGR
ncbi:MAG TPA: alpha/beta fold hydrolase [Candidatus Limnocylindrales bacterium]|nr:alpha/beta fold hydrolase [Candidatus Limnocylindrales bacterium]